VQLTVNGARQSIDLSPATVEGLLAALALPAERVAVEVNGALVRKAERARALVDGDNVEIVTLVGGG
jgi:sulfur carrier protein